MVYYTNIIPLLNHGKIQQGAILIRITHVEDLPHRMDHLNHGSHGGISRC